jgi:glutamyl-tRNA reductase
MGQLTGALGAAHAAGSNGTVLHRLLHNALTAGKLVRSNTGISHNHLSVVSIALDMAEQMLGSLADRRCLIVGAGHTADLALKHLRARDVRNIAITNRTPTRATALADRYDARVWPFEALGAALAASDVVVSCTSAPTTVIDAPLLQRALDQCDRELLLLDLAVPRDIDPRAGAVPGARLIDIDDMRAVAESNRAARAAEAARADTLVAGEVARFEEWFAAQRVTPTIRALRERAESIRAAEVQRTLSKCPALSPHEQQAIEALSTALVNKLLHHPIAALKQTGDDGVAQLVHQLFNLNEQTDEQYVVR